MTLTQARRDRQAVEHALRIIKHCRRHARTAKQRRLLHGFKIGGLWFVRQDAKVQA